MKKLNKINTNKLSATEKFSNDLKIIMQNYYKDMLSEGVKEAVEKQRIETADGCVKGRCCVKNCKV